MKLPNIHHVVLQMLTDVKTTNPRKERERERKRLSFAYQADCVCARACMPAWLISPYILWSKKKKKSNLTMIECSVILYALCVWNENKR